MASRTVAARLMAASAVLGVVAGSIGGAVAARPGRAVVTAVSAAPLTAADPAVVEGAWPVVVTVPESIVPGSFLVADALGDEVPIFDRPDGAEIDRLANPTWEGLAVVFGVLDHRGEWMQVRVSTRPNGRTAWVRAVDVRMRRVPNWIKVELGLRRLTVFHRDEPLLTTEVAIGRSYTPTPTGSYFVDGRVLLDPLHPAYGAGQVSISAFSEQLRSFGGGVGQIALHGTMAPALLGQAISNGCVRMANDALVAVLDLAPTGTPVEVVP